jgi:hypothetical protein
VSGPAICALAIGDAPELWREVGFEVDDEGRCQVGATTLELGAGGAGIVGWTLSGSGPDAVDGVPTRWADGPAAASVEHRNTAVSVDHVVLATPDLDRTRAELEGVGMLLRREREAGERRQLFFRHGEAILEVVGPAAGPTQLWGLTITVADLDAAAALLGPCLGDAHDAVQPGRRIATVRRDAGLGVPLALMSGA